MSESTVVDGDIIQDVALQYDMGAGALKGLLESEHLDQYEDESREIQAVEEAYQKQRERNNSD